MTLIQRRKNHSFAVTTAKQSFDTKLMTLRPRPCVQQLFSSSMAFPGLCDPKYYAWRQLSPAKPLTHSTTLFTLYSCVRTHSRCFLMPLEGIFVHSLMLNEQHEKFPAHNRTAVPCDHLGAEFLSIPYRDHPRARKSIVNGSCWHGQPEYLVWRTGASLKPLHHGRARKGQ